MNLLVGTLFNTIALVVGVLIFRAYAERQEAETDLTHVLVAGVLGGAAIAILSQTLLGGSPQGGRTIIGGVAGGWIAVEIAKRRLGIRSSTGLGWALALSAGEAIGRIGCWFNGCCYGKVASVPWALWQHGALRHPTQLYSSLSAAAIFGLVYAARRTRDPFAICLALWSGARFVIEFFREPISGPGFPSLAQECCLGFLAVAAFRLARAYLPSRSLA